MTPEITYLTNSTQLQGIANAIRSKAGTSENIVYPDGFISAIENISTGGNEKWRGMYNPDLTGSFSVTDMSCVRLRDYAFYLCRTITDADFQSCQYVAPNAFFNCANLKTANFPSCTSIGAYAFGYCYSLTSINFPMCISINNFAFDNCYNLTTANFPACTSIGSKAFQSCRTLTTISFPSCLSVGSQAFVNCSNISVARLNNCAYIGSSAFASCENLLEVYILASSVCALADANAFASTPIDGYTASTSGIVGRIYVPQSLVAAYQSASVWSYFSSVIYPEY